LSLTGVQMEFLALEELKIKLAEARLSGEQIGFVPTMGALHEGHLAIIERAAKENHWAVVSIFVNPTQFNNREDLDKYPRTLTDDLRLLAHISNLFVFQPDVAQVYPNELTFNPINLGQLAKVMEGKFRPGHFDGVVHVVHNLFLLVHPTRAYFGKKDYQQLAIIRKLVQEYQFPIEVIACETTRSANGLALSSRNKRLSNQGLIDALIITKTLTFISKSKGFYSINEMREQAVSYFSQGKLELEYLEFMNELTLNPATSWDEPVVCFIAAYCEGIRLIDNLLV
jgi:pantoate--beta-alanine ligase